MLGAERRAHIVEQAQRDGSVRVADLVASLHVSDVTVRRDIDLLAQEGLLEKVHGGALLARESSTGTPARAAVVEPDTERLGRPQPAEARHHPVVGVLVPKSPYYFKRVVDGARDVLRAESRLVLAVSDYEPGKERDLVAGLLDAGAEALLLAPCALGEESGDDARTWIEQLPVPVVLVERRLVGLSRAGISSVRTAHENGAAAAVAHLAGLGHRRIALFTRGDTPTALGVRNGWRQALEQLRLPTDVPCVSGTDLPGWPRWEPQQVEQFARRLKDDGATALLCHSDEDALALLQNGLSTSLDVPGELSVVAYDDEFSEFANPPLTAVSPPKYEVGSLAMRTLLEITADPDASVRHIEVEPRLIIRDSTGPRAAALRRPR